MTRRDDRDDTNVGGPLPSVPRPTPHADPMADPFAWPAVPPPSHGPAPSHSSRPSHGAAEADRTIIGGALPGYGAQPGPGSGQVPGQPFGQAPGYAQTSPYGAPAPWPGTAPSSDNTWIGGATPPAQPGPAGGGWHGQPPSPGWQGGGQAPGFGIGLGAGLDAQGGQGFFPALHPQHQPGPALSPVPRISLQQALKATGIGEGGSANPLLSAATNLLILFGRLRTGIVELDAPPLMEHVTREVEGFERHAISAGAPPQEALVAKYLLCGTADDIVQNLPGADRGLWIQYSMAARFFNTRDTGVGFFREAEKAIQSPAQYVNLLELMLVCLSLGFEGQYRTVQGGTTQLARIRSAIYEAVRRVRNRPDEDLSRSWLPVVLGGKRRFGAIPVWVIGGVAAAALVAFFATLSTLITREGAAAADTLYRLHPTDQKIALNGQLPAVPFVAPVDNSQIDRIRAGLQAQIDQGLVTVGELGDFIYIRVGILLLFDTGAATVKEEFAPLASEIAKVVNAEKGPVLIEGYTDNVPTSGRGRYKSNLDLSLARAEGVAAVLRPMLGDPARVQVEGRGEAQPIADNETEDGRALNRRVEVMIAKEGTFEAP